MKRLYQGSAFRTLCNTKIETRKIKKKGKKNTTNKVKSILSISKKTPS